VLAHERHGSKPKMKLKLTERAGMRPRSIEMLYKHQNSHIPLACLQFISCKKKRLPAKKALLCIKKRYSAKKSVCLQFF
jgi:hypothetical protein